MASCKSTRRSLGRLAAVLAASPAAAAQNIIINNNVQVGAAHWCRGLGCLFWHPGSPGWPIAEQGRTPAMCGMAADTFRGHARHERQPRRWPRRASHWRRRGLLRPQAPERDPYPVHRDNRDNSDRVHGVSIQIAARRGSRHSALSNVGPVGVNPIVADCFLCRGEVELAAARQVRKLPFEAVLALGIPFRLDGTARLWP
jgi:hypothetical protein